MNEKRENSEKRPVVLYGPVWSAYTRTVRLVLIEKGIAHTIESVDFSTGEMPVGQLRRHPFGKVPALGHGDYLIYETSAICRYLDTAFTGPDLQPEDPMLLGRMSQVIALQDAYLSEPIRMGYVSEKLVHPMMGLPTDRNAVDIAQKQIKTGFTALEQLVTDTEFLIAEQLSLADLHLLPLIDYLTLTPGGNDLLAPYPRLHQWWSRIRLRQSVVDTSPDLGVFLNRNDT